MIKLPIMCRSFRQTATTQECVVHGNCEVAPDFAKCSDFDPVKRAEKPNAHCACVADGYCERYGRSMHGRDRQICRGENVDAGEAANLRALWRQEKKSVITTKCESLGAAIPDTKRSCRSCGGTTQRQVFSCKHPARDLDQVTVEDCGACIYHSKPLTGQPLILSNKLCAGDVLVMSAAIHSLHKAYPGKFLVAVDTSADAIYEHNPDIVSKETLTTPQHIQMHYPACHESNTRGIHFMQGYCEHLGDALGLRIPLASNRPLAYLSSREKVPTRAPYWLINAGGKDDFTNKLWPYYQQVVDALPNIHFIQVGLDHAPLRGVENLVGKTDIRQLMQLTYHADGVLCGVTLLQHLAAAFQKPSVVIMGGREPVQWNSYPKQQLVHTVGSLECCSEGGCWKSRVVPLNDGSVHDTSLCMQPLANVPKCMSLITPDHVARLTNDLYRHNR